MLSIPYAGSSTNACALACYTMIAKYFFPETTREQIAKTCDWKPGYVVWPYKFWFWIMEKRIKVTDYDLINMDAWINEGVAGLQRTLPQQEFSFFYENTKNHDLETLTQDAVKVMKHPNFTYHFQKPSMQLLKQALAAEKPCEVVLNSRALDNEKGFALHRIVVTGINDEKVTFHDPQETPTPNRQEGLNHFESAWLVPLDEPELCVYERV